MPAPDAGKVHPGAAFNERGGPTCCYRGKSMITIKNGFMCITKNGDKDQPPMYINLDNIAAITPSGGGEYAIALTAFVLGPQGPIPLTLRLDLTQHSDLREAMDAELSRLTDQEKALAKAEEAMEILRGYAAKAEIPLEVPRTPSAGNEWIACGYHGCDADFGVCLICARCVTHHLADVCLACAVAQKPTAV